MANYYLQELPNLDKQGKRRVYPKLSVNRTMTTDDLIKQIQSYHRGVSPAIIGSVVTSLTDTLKRMLSMGYNVSIDDLGIFSLSLQFEDKKPKEMESDGDRMAYRKVGVKDVNFAASKDVLKDLRRMTELQRDMQGVNCIRKIDTTFDERLSMALDHIDTHGFLTLSDYVSLTHLSRTAASLELKEIVNMPQSQITDKGTGSHKCWVRKAEVKQ
ncbi:MAG: hypothetical protein ACI4B3_02385 [Prevotella sp.]